ncbi:MAG TPA: cytochrome b/b6 domain-containing protein, partial [Burkholderiales bacterium]|nr:cytochrome b/b6 domain-containing protein [Burkholderiales bacterium]
MLVVVDPEEPTVRVWDPLVRAAHWLLVASVLVAWITIELPGKLAAAVHEWAGYTALGVVALRFVWGLVGPRYARFAQ